MQKIIQRFTSPLLFVKSSCSSAVFLSNGTKSSHQQLSRSLCVYALNLAESRPAQTQKNNTSNVSENNIGTCSLPGRKKRNEDRYDSALLKPNVQYFAVFDGHNGTFVSQFAYKNMPLILKKQLAEISDTETNPDVYEAILQKSFEICEDALEKTLVMMKNLEKKDMTGSTAVIGLLVDNKYLTVANVGDSRAILCRNGQTEVMDMRHNPDVISEADRIVQAGGWVDWDTKMKPMVNGRLSLTRSFGNVLFKPDIVPALPSIKSDVINSETDSFLVLCSDGVTHSVTKEEIMYIVNQHHCPVAAAEDLATSAQQFGSDDDITVIVVPFDAWGTIEVRPAKRSYSMFRTMMGGRADG